MERPNDALTGLPGRVAMEDELAQRLGQREPFAVALVDVDFFQEINDGYGHGEGDRTLQKLAALLGEAGLGTAYRISGDEFALVIPQVTLEQAFLQVERLRALVSGTAFGLADGRTVTITAGVAHSPRDAKEVQALLNAADAALLSAKEGGRDQVALPPNEEMVLKSCYYSSASLRKLKTLAERLSQRESYLLRDALTDLLRKHDAARLP
jgi:diguanylate cyclase